MFIFGFDARAEGDECADALSFDFVGVSDDGGFGFAIAKRGLFGDDVLGMTVSRPLRNFSVGNLNAMLAPGSNSVLGMPTSSFAPVGTDAKEADFTLGYVTTFMDGALALQANAAYQLNANGDQGQDAVSVLSRARIQF